MKMYNQAALHELVTGKNKAFITRTINKQRKYGNYDIFEACYKDDYKYGPTIEFALGESYGVFRPDRRTGEWQRDYGNIYHETQVLEIVKELAKTLEVQQNG